VAVNERIVTFEPARDCILIPAPNCKRHTDCDPSNPAKNYGRGGMTIRMVLRADDLAVQFVWMPGVYLPETDQWAIEAGHAVYRGGYGEPRSFWAPMAADLGWHVPWSPPPVIGEGEWHEWPFYGSHFERCEYFEGGCYYDGSGLNAQPILDLLIGRDGREAG
jgi:hypothetical protein